MCWRNWWPSAPLAATAQGESLPRHLYPATFHTPHFYTHISSRTMSPQYFLLSRVSPTIYFLSTSSAHSSHTGDVSPAINDFWRPSNIAFAVIPIAYRDFLLLSFTEETRDNINLLTRVVRCPLNNFSVISMYCPLQNSIFGNITCLSRLSFVVLDKGSSR